MKNSISTLDHIKDSIYTIREKRVMLDRDLAQLYRVTTGNLNKSVKRNIDRFPKDFMFQLTKKECDNLRFQIGRANISSKSRSLPYVFTEHGTLMLASILKSNIAVQINQMVIRAFVELRSIVNTYPEHEFLSEKLNSIESRMDTI